MNILITVLFLLGMLPAQSAIGLSCSESGIVLNTDDSGAGSLRQAIADVCSEGTITFDTSLSGATITLATGQLVP